MRDLPSIIIGTAASLLVAGVALAQQGGAPGYGHSNWGGGWHGWFMGPLMMLIFLALAALAIGLVLRSAGLLPRSGEDGGKREALGILEERFARGEIDQDEFEKRRDVLRS